MTVTRTTPVEQWPSLLRPEEAAALLDCSKGLVYEMCRRNQLPSVRLGRLLRIPREALAAMAGRDVGRLTTERLEEVAPVRRTQ